MQEYEKKAKRAKNYRQALKKRGKACASTKKNDFSLEVNTAKQAIQFSFFDERVNRCIFRYKSMKSVKIKINRFKCSH